MGDFDTADSLTVTSKEQVQQKKIQINDSSACFYERMYF